MGVYEYSILTYSSFYNEIKLMDCSFEGLCTFFISRTEMINNLGRFEDGVRIVIFCWQFGMGWFLKSARNESILRRRSCF